MPNRNPTAVHSVPDLSFEFWRVSMQTPRSEDEVLKAVATYLGSWRFSEQVSVPSRLLTPIPSVEELHRRAKELAQTEAEPNTTFDRERLRDLALVISTAAARAYHLQRMKIH